MIISQSRGKVKNKVLSLVKGLKLKLSLPLLKFVSEMVMGILLTGSCNINLIASFLKEQIAVKDTIKRLHRMLLNNQVLKIANELSLQESLKKINEDTILALDGGDITHQYGEKFEQSTFVKDGSSGELRQGYWLNQISGYNPASRETFPILLYIYSTLESGFKSANIETFKIVDKVISQIGQLGLWVIDRGYDGGKVLNYFLSRGLDFMLRMNTTRNYNRIQTLLGLTILSWLVLIKINEHGRLREVVLKEARMEKDKPKHRPRFIYYRLLRGIQNMFAGIKRIFCFRLKRLEKEQLKSKMLNDYPLFRQLPFDNFWLEEVA